MVDWTNQIFDSILACNTYVKSKLACNARSAVHQYVGTPQLNSNHSIIFYMHTEKYLISNTVLNSLFNHFTHGGGGCISIKVIDIYVFIKIKVNTNTITLVSSWIWHLAALN